MAAREALARVGYTLAADGRIGPVQGEEDEAEGVLHARAPEGVELPPEHQEGVGDRLTPVPPQAGVQQVELEGACLVRQTERDDVPAARGGDEETGYRFVASSSAPVHVQEAWWGTPRGYAHGVVFVFQGDVAGDLDPAWTQDHGEIVQVAWRAPEELSEATTRSLHWPALRKAGVV